MSKPIYCAVCGGQILIYRKAFPKQQKTYILAKPHRCPEEIEGDFVAKPIKTPVDLNQIFDKFKFVSKLNDLEEKIPEPKVEEEDEGMALSIMLGFVPAKISAEISAALEISDDVICTITEVTPSAKPWERIKVVIAERIEEEDEEESNV